MTENLFDFLQTKPDIGLVIKITRIIFTQNARKDHEKICKYVSYAFFKKLVPKITVFDTQGTKISQKGLENKFLKIHYHL